MVGRRRIAGSLVAIFLLSLLAYGRSAAAITAPLFGWPQRLPTWSGGEPSLAFDPTGKILYVVAPQGIPSVLNAFGEGVRTLDEAGVFDMENPDIISAAPPSQVRTGTQGIAFWASLDGGATWRRTANIGSAAGGGDTDVVVAPDRTVYVTDLEAASTAICSSRDFGATFTATGTPMVDTCTVLPGNQTGPVNDRPWLSVSRAGTLYLTYHDFVTGMPIVLSSTDRAKTFAPCGTMLDPQGPAAANFSPVAGTIVSKPAIAKDGSIFTAIAMPDRASSPTGGPLRKLYVAIARRGCGTSTVWQNVKIYENPRADFKLFQSIAIDGGGVLYAIASGKTGNQSTENIWLFTSRDGGLRWSAPIRVNPPALLANAMPVIAGGLRGNQLAVSWYGTSTNAHPSNIRNQWRYFAATSFDGGRTFKYATLTPKPIHYGTICTDGVVCLDGRNLADFTSIAIHPITGCVTTAYAGDQWNRPDLDPERDDGLSAAFISRQIRGTCLR